jgi:hypothetical protein
MDSFSFDSHRVVIADQPDSGTIGNFEIETTAERSG